MTGLQAIKDAVEEWHCDCNGASPPKFILKLCHVVFRLNKEVFNFKKGTWEHEGF